MFNLAVKAAISTMRIIMKKRFHDSGFYEGNDERRKQESQDAALLSYDKSATANLPQNVVMRDFPNRGGGSNSPALDDTMKGIDKQMAEDNKKARKNLK